MGGKKIWRKIQKQTSCRVQHCAKYLLHDMWWQKMMTWIIDYKQKQAPTLCMPAGGRYDWDSKCSHSYINTHTYRNTFRHIDMAKCYTERCISLDRHKEWQIDSLDPSQQSIRLSLKRADISFTPQGGTQAQLRFLACSKMEVLETRFWISIRAFCLTLHFYDPLGYKGVQAIIMATGIIKHAPSASRWRTVCTPGGLIQLLFKPLTCGRELTLITL